MQSYEFLKTWRERARTWQAKVPAPAAMPSDVAMEGAVLAGDPLVTLVQPVLPADLFAGAVADVAGLLAAYRTGAEAQAPTAIAAAVSGASADDRTALVAAVLTEGGVPAWAAAHQVDPTLLGTVAGLALQPFMARFAEAVTAEAPLGMWRRNYCPTCGSPADVCRIDTDNIRMLHCPTCDTQWEHHRLTCVNCDTEDTQKVNILTVETLEPWRVEVCEVCGGYTKSLDQRHGGHLAMPRVDLFLEDARTLALDVLAEQEGYRRGGRVQ
jgi:FdhE protein